MDIARDPKPRMKKRIIQWSAAAIALTVITVILRNLEPPAKGAPAWPSVVTEGRHRFDEMSLPRFAFWGWLGVLLLSGSLAAIGALGQTTGIVTYGVLPLLGAGSAAGSLALARRADDRELLEHGADVADIGLTEEERHELLAG